MILRVPEYYNEFSCIASRCKDSCCAGWEIDIDEESYEYYRNVEGPFGDRLRESMYEAKDEDGGYRFKLKGLKRCAMLNDNNLCDLYTALGEEALCEVCTEYPRFSLVYGQVEQKALSLSCEEVGRILFNRTEPEQLIDIELPGDCEDDEEDPLLVAFMEWVQKEAVAILQNRENPIPYRAKEFLAWCDLAQNALNHAEAMDDLLLLNVWKKEQALQQLRAWENENPVQKCMKTQMDDSVDDQNGEATEEAEREQALYEDFCDRFEVFLTMEELDDEWINTKAEFEKLYHADTYGKLLREYLDSDDYSELGYEHLLVYFVYRYLMNAVYDYDILSYAKMIVVATLVVRDMDAARYQRNGRAFTMFDRIDIARIFSKEVEHSEGNAEDLKEMCMMEEIASIEALERQIEI